MQRRNHLVGQGKKGLAFLLMHDLCLYDRTRIAQCPTTLLSSREKFLCGVVEGVRFFQI